MNKQVFVDCDGTLLSSRLDELYKAKERALGVSSALEWYKTVTDEDDLELNVPMWLELTVLKAQGFDIVLWTNRGHEQMDMTLRNLSKYGIADMFSMFVFGDGHKLNTNVGAGIVFDNDERNACGIFHLVNTFE